MPNWCLNQLMVSGPAEEVARFKKQAVGHSPWLTPKEKAGEPPSPLNFHSLVPVPEEVLKPGYGDPGYYWELTNWGAKWGACDARVVEESDGCVVYSFSTAWAPPLAFLERVSRQWPELTLILDYNEPGMGFKGIAKGRGEQF